MSTRILWGFASIYERYAFAEDGRLPEHHKESPQNMCVIIVTDTPKEHPITSAEIERACVANPHGWGLAVLYKGFINIRKGMDTKDAVHAVEQAQKDCAGAIVFHARIATSGDVCEDQCHPYPCPAPDKAQRYLFHNGILRGIPEINPAKSDTWHLAKTMRRYANTANLWEFLESYAQQNASRFVLVTPEYGVSIFNRKSGIDRDGKWYSGSSAFYTPPTPAKWSKGKQYYKGTKLAIAQTASVLDYSDEALQNDESFLEFLAHKNTNERFMDDGCIAQGCVTQALPNRLYCPTHSEKIIVAANGKGKKK
jgi:hypothetical protein